MKHTMTKKEGKAYLKRWKEVNRILTQELRNTSPIMKLRQLASLMFSVDWFGWRKALTKDENRVRNRWNRLRKLYHV